MIKLAAFDLDGTIADTLEMCMEAFKKAVSPYVGHTLTREEVVKTYGLNEKGMIRAVTEEHWEEALRDFYIKYEELHGLCERPFEGIVSLIEMLKESGVIVALVTGKGEETCRMTLERLGMIHLFSDIMTGNEYKNGKKDSLLALMEKYSVSEAECVYIGDAVSDVTASHEAGIRCLSAAWAESADKEGLFRVNEGSVYESISELREHCIALGLPALKGAGT